MADDVDLRAALDAEALTAAVRRLLERPAAEVTSWEIVPFGHSAVIEVTAGVHRVTGMATDADGGHRWALALKILRDPLDFGQRSDDWTFWRREADAYASGLVDLLPPEGVTAPRCFGVEDRGPQRWVWLELIEDTSAVRWSVDDVATAASALGRTHGAWLGRAHPSPPWLATDFFASFWDPHDFWLSFMDPDSASNAWQVFVVAEAFADQRGRVVDLWRQVPPLITINQRLPRVLCHNDFHRNNLMLRGANVVVIDWAFASYGSLGNDLGELVGTGAYSYHFVESVEIIERAAVEGYLDGLRSSGWSGDERLVRLGYLLGLTLWWGATVPGWVAWNLGPDATTDIERTFGVRSDAALAHWVELESVLLDRADEARALARTLNLA